MKNNKKNIIIIVSIVVIILSFLLCATFIPYKIKFSLRGNNQEFIKQYAEYDDPGYSAYRCSLFICKDISSDVIIEGNIDSSIVNNYIIKYIINTKKREYILTREIIVLDGEKPQLKLAGDNPSIVCPKHKYEEAGFEAVDNIDGDVSNNVKITAEGDKIIYSVSDSSGNIETQTREIVYKDDTLPTINLKGNNNINHNLDEDYVEPGYTASDNCDGNITANVNVTGTVNTRIEGTYTLIYQVSDSSGNKVSVKRQIRVLNKKTRDILSYQESLEKYIKDQGYKVSIIYYNLQNGYIYKYRPNVVYYGASLIKTLDALYVYEKLSDREDLKSLVKPAITISDNIAHRQLVDAIGINNLRAYGSGMGAKYCLTKGDSDYYANTTAEDQLIYMKYLWSFINSNSLGGELKQYFINDFHNHLAFNNNIPVMHKYGYYGNYFHDVGIVFDNMPYIVIILTNEGKNDYATIINDLSKRINHLHSLVS